MAIGIDASSLSDPSLAPREALQVVVPRPGVTARIDIPLVGAGDIEGVLVKDDGSGFEGLDLELIDASGRTVATARSDYDGFFLFERVAYGRYTFRLAAASASAAQAVARRSTRRPRSSPAKSVVRLGVLRLRAGGSAIAARRRINQVVWHDFARRRPVGNMPCISMIWKNGAVEKTRTSTGFRPQRPQRCASTSSATTARRIWPRGNPRPLARRRP